MIHPTAIIDPTAEIDDSADIGPFTIVQARAKIGARSVVWSGVNILADVVIGSDCSIGTGSEIGRGSTIGDRARIGWRCFLPSHSVIGKWVFVGPGVKCSDDRTPRVPAPTDPAYNAEPPVIEDGASIGLGAILIPGIRIGAGARVAAGSLVTKDVGPGNKVRGYDTAAQPFEPSESAKAGGW